MRVQVQVIANAKHPTTNELKNADLFFWAVSVDLTQTDTEIPGKVGLPPFLNHGKLASLTIQMFLTLSYSLQVVCGALTHGKPSNMYMDTWTTNAICHMISYRWRGSSTPCVRLNTKGPICYGKCVPATAKTGHQYDNMYGMYTGWCLERSLPPTSLFGKVRQCGAQDQHQPEEVLSRRDTPSRHKKAANNKQSVISPQMAGLNHN